MHQITFATSRTRPSSSSGSPSRTPTVRGTRSTPAAASSFGRTRSSGAAVRRDLGRIFRPIGVLTVSTCEATNQNGGRQHPAQQPPMRTGTWPRRRCPRARSDASRDDLERDLGARVTGADDQHAALLQLRRVPVLASSRTARCSGRARRRTPAPLSPGSAPVATTTLSASNRRSPAHDGTGSPFRREPSTRTPVRTGKLEPCGVGLEVVGHAVLRRERPARRRKRQARQARVARGRERGAASPSAAARIADPLVRVQDHERQPAPREVVPRRQACLPAADDHGLERSRPARRRSASCVRD